VKPLFKQIHTIADEISSAIVMFSSGKDSVAMIDLVHKHMDVKKCRFVYMYFVKGLSWRERLFRHYEKRYGIKIEQYPQVDVTSIYKNQAFVATGKNIKKLSQPKMEAFLRHEYNIPWILYGYKKSDSLQRRGMLSIIDGIDHKYKKAYPVSDWSEKDVYNYCKRERLPLPADYGMGFRDVNMFEGKSLLWVYRNFPKDYEKIKNTYPFIEAELLRHVEQI